MIDVILSRKIELAERICGFEIAAASGEPLPAFGAGSHIDVHLPGGITRQYSLCNAPGGGGHYEIAVLLEEESRGGSMAMHGLSEGDRFSISEPRNLFPLVPDSGHVYLFAGGIGITPIVCMAERLAHTGAGFELHYCARSPERAAFVERIRKSSFAAQSHLYLEGSAGLPVADILHQHKRGDHLYVCGPAGFIEFILDQARGFGWPEENLHREFFAATPVEGDDHSFEIQIASSGRCLTIPPDRSVADILEEAGIEISLSCEQGVCGTCITGVLAGEPEHRDMFLTDEEHARNDQFTPCCSRAKTARLVLDL